MYAFNYTDDTGTTRIGFSNNLPNNYGLNDINNIVKLKERDSSEFILAANGFISGHIVYDLIKAKEVKKNNIKPKVNEYMEVITSKYSQAEIDSWPIQEAEARGDRPDDFLLKLAQSSNIPLAQLKTDIITKADIFKTAVAEAIGRRKKMETIISAATSIEELKTITY